MSIRRHSDRMGAKIFTMVLNFLDANFLSNFCITGIALASQIEDLQIIVELAKFLAKYYFRKK